MPPVLASLPYGDWAPFNGSGNRHDPRTRPLGWAADHSRRPTSLVMSAPHTLAEPRLRRTVRATGVVGLLVAGPAHAQYAATPGLGDLPHPHGQTTFYLDTPNPPEGQVAKVRVFHDGTQLEVERLGPCALPGDANEYPCFRAVSERTGLLTLRIDTWEDGAWLPGDEMLIGLSEAGGAVVAHLPRWQVYTYPHESGRWAVGLGGEWTKCVQQIPLPAEMGCFDGHWAFPNNDLMRIELDHEGETLRRYVIPLAGGVYTFYRSRSTIWGTLTPAP